MRTPKFLLCGLLALCCAACSVTRTRTYAPASTKLDLQMSDLNYIGQTEISVDFRTYLGFIRVTDALNGTPYDGREQLIARVGGDGTHQQLRGKLRRAAVKLLEEFPDADYFVVVKQIRHKNRLFLGAEITDKAVVKAYSFK